MIFLGFFMCLHALRMASKSSLVNSSQPLCHILFIALFAKVYVPFAYASPERFSLFVDFAIALKSFFRFAEDTPEQMSYQLFHCFTVRSVSQSYAIVKYFSHFGTCMGYLLVWYCDAYRLNSFWRGSIIHSGT